MGNKLNTLTYTQLKSRKIIFTILKFLILIIPNLILIIVKKDEYFTEKSGLSLSIGFIMTAVVIVCILLKRAKFLKGFWGIVIAFMISYFLQAILDDLTLILGLACIGMALSMLVDIPLNRINKILDIVDTTECTEIAKDRYTEKKALDTTTTLEESGR